MWRHSLLMRCKPSFRIFTDPAVSLRSETRCLNPKLFVKSVCTNNRSLFPTRCYSKVASEVLPEIGLEVKPARSETDHSEPRGPTPVLKGNDIDSGGKITYNNAPTIHEDIKYNESELPHNDSPKPTISEIDPEGAPWPRPKPSITKDETDFDNELSQNHSTAVDEKRPMLSRRPKPAITTNETDLEDIDLEVRSTPKEVFVDNNADFDVEPMPTAKPSRPKPRNILRGYEDRIPERQLTVQEKMLLEGIDNKNEISSDQWDELRKMVLSAGNVLNEDNIDTTIMGKCIELEQLSTGLSYMNYLSASNHVPNVATISRFFRLALLCSSDVDDHIQSIVTSLYNSLRLRHPIFDATTADAVIQGLSVTNQWKEGLEILDELRLTAIPNSLVFSVLIKASFNNNEPDIGWELMLKMVREKKKPREMVYDAWLQYCRRSAAGNKVNEQKLVEKLLHFLATYDIRLTENEVKLIRLWYEYEAPPDADWNAQYTTVDTRGMCKSCNQFLSNIAVTVKEFEALKSVFIEKALVDSNIFLKSTPEELTEFENFVKATAPYDVVIDGLNVGYSTNGKGNSKTQGKMLKLVVQYFVERSQKVLVLGRRHMDKWSKDNMAYVYKNAEVFLTQNTSEDDPYLLYAAMYSGLGTRFISRDLMRSHSYILQDPTLQSSFMRWQKKYQLQVAHIGDDGFVKFRLQPKFDTAVQLNKYGSWHIPYNLITDSTRHQSFNTPRQWLCLSHFKERSYDQGDENDSYEFTNSRQENRGYSRNNNMSSQFRNSSQHRFEDADDETTSSRFGKSNFRNRGFDGDKMSRFKQSRPSSQNYHDLDEDDEEPPRFTKREPRKVNSAFDDENMSSRFEKSNFRNRGFDGDKMSRFKQSKPSSQNYHDLDEDDDEPSRFTKREPRKVNSAFEDIEEPQPQQFKRSSGRYVDQRFGGEMNTNQNWLSKPYEQDLFDDDIQLQLRSKPKFRPASKVTDGEDSSDEQTFKSKQAPSNKKLSNEMFQSESKQDFKANRNRTQQKPVKKEDDIWDM